MNKCSQTSHLGSAPTNNALHESNRCERCSGQRLVRISSKNLLRWKGLINKKTCYQKKKLEKSEKKLKNQSKKFKESFRIAKILQNLWRAERVRVVDGKRLLGTATFQGQMLAWLDFRFACNFFSKFSTFVQNWQRLRENKDPKVFNDLMKDIGKPPSHDQGRWTCGWGATKRTGFFIGRVTALYRVWQTPGRCEGSSGAFESVREQLERVSTFATVRPSSATGPLHHHISLFQCARTFSASKLMPPQGLPNAQFGLNKLDLKGLLCPESTAMDCSKMD